MKFIVETVDPETGHVGCSSGTQTSPLKSVSSFRYVGDVKSDVLYSPTSAKRAIEKCIEKIEEQNSIIKKQKVSITRLKKKVEELGEILRDFRDKGMLSDNAHETLDVRYLFFVFFRFISTVSRGLIFIAFAINFT